MSLQKIDEGTLKKYRQTLKDCSKNDSNEPVTQAEYEVYNFDALGALEAEKYRRKKKLCSADAFYIRNEKQMFFFEFKNARKSQVPWKSIPLKAHDSLLTIQALLFPKLSLQECAQRISYFVIYNNHKIADAENESKSFEKLKEKMGTLAQKTSDYPILWDMDIYEDTFYKKVYTIDVSDFEHDFMKQIFG